MTHIIMKIQKQVQKTRGLMLQKVFQIMAVVAHSEHIYVVSTFEFTLNRRLGFS